MNSSTQELKTEFNNCVKCGKEIRSKKNLRAHLRTHEEDPKLKFPFPCGICQKRFSRSTYLREHMRTHETNPKLRFPFPCGICQKRFTRLVELRQHLRTHETDPKLRFPFMCQICQKRCSTSCNLRRHFRTHDMDPKLRYPYECYVCSKRFFDKRNLNNHSWIHDKPFDSHRCDLKFQEEINLVEHMLVHCHTDSDSNSVFKKQLIQQKDDTVVSKQSVLGPATSKQLKYDHNSNIFLQYSNTQLMGQDDQPKSDERKQFTQKNLQYDEKVGYLSIHSNVCNDEFSSEVSFTYPVSELEPNLNLKSSVECNICKGCFLNSQSLVAHLQLVHSISAQFDLYINKTGLQEYIPMNEDSIIVPKENPHVHNLCSEEISQEGCLKSQCSRSGKYYSTYQEEVLLNAQIESGKQLVQQEENTIHSKEKNTNLYIHSICQEDNLKQGREQQYMKKNFKGGTYVYKEELTSGISSKHQNIKLESIFKLSSSVERNFGQCSQYSQSSVGHHGMVDSRTTLYELANMSELQEYGPIDEDSNIVIEEYLKDNGFP